MLYFWFLRLMFIFCLGAFLYASFGEKAFGSNFDNVIWMMITYPVMWIALLLYKYELSNSDNDLARVVNTQNTANSFQYIMFLHTLAFILYSVSHGHSDLSIHYFLDFLRYCALAYILYEFVIGVLNMFYGILYETIVPLFKREKQWK